MAFDSPPGEQLSRFLTDRSQYSPTKGVVRHAAFHPPKNGQLSVYWITAILDAEIWTIGDTHVAPLRGPILGRADFNSLVAYANRLSVRVTGIPHPRHSDVVDWDADRQKNRLQAVKLAEEAQLILKP